MEYSKNYNLEVVDIDMGIFLATSGSALTLL